MKILLSSHNRKKIAELRAILSEELGREDITILSLDDIGETEEIPETGATFLENAKIKAAVGQKLGYISVADDSGLAVDYLSGAPGVYSARFAEMAGREKSDASNNAYLLELLRDVPDEKRVAHFVSTIACYFPDGTLITAEGTVDGRILRAPVGDAGFGYDPLFYTDEFGKTFAELSPDEKNSISHRGKALRAFAAEFKKIWEEKYAEQ